MTRAAIYARVSSIAQRDAHTIENQLRSLPAFVASQGWELAGTYVDDGHSAKTGRLEARDGFARLVRDATAGRFDVLVVADIDRLTRTDDMRERASILGPFQAAGIRIVTPAGGELDLRTMLGELYVTLHAIVAAEENRKRASRIKLGKARAIAEGRKPAGPTPFGLHFDRPSGTWSIDPVEAAVVREIFARVAAGDSCDRIADELNRRGAARPRVPWSRGTVYRIVRSRAVVGEWCVDKVRGVVIRVPEVVEPAVWDAAHAALLTHRKRGLRRTRHVYLLEGLASCGSCGSPIGVRSAGTYAITSGERRPSPAAYVCRGRKRDQVCKAPIVRTTELDARIWSRLSAELEQPEILQALADVGRARSSDARDWESDAHGFRAHLERLERLERDTMARHRRGLVSDGALEHELDALARERRAVRDQLVAAERATRAVRSAQARLDAARSSIGALRSALPTATPEQRRAILRELVGDGGIVIRDGRARLDLRLLLPDDAAKPAPSLSIVPVTSPGYRSCHGNKGSDSLRLRLVA